MRPTLLLACLGLAACARGPEPTTPTTPASTPAPAPAPTPAPAAAPQEPAPVATAPTSAPAPAPITPPAPALPVAPDGTQAVACLDPAPAGLACIPGGPFIRGSDTGPKHSRPQATVWLQTFYMDIHEITYAEYKQCEKDGKCGKAGPLYNDFSRPRQPISGISWYNAVEFCKAQGKHLPTEAQWEKAARGPDGKTHPWGDEPATCERAVIKDKTGRSCGVQKKGSQGDKGRTFEIGARPPYQYGLHDMSGNSWEWVADWMSESYAACGKDCEGVDPLGPCGGAEPCKGHAEKIVRGGSWYWDAKHATALYRRPHFPKNQPFHHFGFRCAASQAEAEQLLKTPPPYSPPPAPPPAKP